MVRSILILVLTGSAMPELAAQEPPDSLYMLNARYSERCAAWETDTMETATVVMLGNSITEGGSWWSLLGRSDVANRGIGSDNTYGYLHRMVYVLDLHPKVCFIMGGINDLYAGFTVETVLRNVAMLLDTLRAHAIVPVVQSTLFASPRWHDAREKNVLVHSLNIQLERMCTARGIPFMDLNSRLARNGVLQDRYTTDGIHLSAEAYKIWSGEVRAFLERHGI